MPLSKSKQKVANLVAEGYTNLEIANKLFLSEGTIKVYISKIFDYYHFNDDESWGNNRVRLVLEVMKQKAAKETTSRRSESSNCRNCHSRCGQERWLPLHWLH